MTGDIISQCTATGLFDDNKVRGAGVWLDEGRLVVNSIETWSPQDPAVGRVTAKHIYLKDRNLDIVPGIKPASDDEVSDVKNALASFGFTRSSDHRLMLGLVMLGYVCAALNWRPHAFVQGFGGAGKSHLMQFLKNLLGGSAELSSFRTAAGLRQRLKLNAVVALCDETEADQKEVAALLEFFRQSAGGTTKDMGTADQKGIRYAARSLGIVSGIVHPLLKSADQTRFLRFTLEAVPESVKNNPHPMLIKRSTKAEALTRSAGEKLCARMLHSWRLFETTQDEVFHHVSGSRLADVIAPVIAACYVAEHSTPCLDIKSYVAGFDVAADTSRISSASESQEFVDHLLATSISLDLDGRRRNLTVGTAISEALVDSQTFSALGIYGLKPSLDKDIVMLRIAYKNPQLTGLFSETKWAKGDLSGLIEMIKRVPGADRKVGDQRDRFGMGGAPQPFLSMPLHGFELPKPPINKNKDIDYVYGFAKP